MYAWKPNNPHCVVPVNVINKSRENNSVIRKCQMVTFVKCVTATIYDTVFKKKFLTCIH